MQVAYKQQKSTAFLLLERGAGISITPRTLDGVLHCALIMDSRHGPSRFTGQILGLLLERKPYSKAVILIVKLRDLISTSPYKRHMVIS